VCANSTTQRRTHPRTHRRERGDPFLDGDLEHPSMLGVARNLGMNRREFSIHNSEIPSPERSLSHGRPSNAERGTGPKSRLSMLFELLSPRKK